MVQKNKKKRKRFHELRKVYEIPISVSTIKLYWSLVTHICSRVVYVQLETMWSAGLKLFTLWPFPGTESSFL